MVAVSLEESTISECSLDASATPTTAAGYSTTSLSHDFLPSPSPTNDKDGRRERSSTTPPETFVKDVSFPFPSAAEQRLRKVSSLFPCLTRVCLPAFLPPPFEQQVKV